MKILNYQLNKVYKDTFGRTSAVLALNKPASITSHDLVDKVRKKLKVRRVGHAGALDPFATGVMIILVGKATKLAQQFLTWDKEYEFEVLLGISTETQDTEGKILKVESPPEMDQAKIKESISGFEGTYKQTVPIFSSIRIDGIRLRELAHASRHIKRFRRDNATYATFTIDKNNPIFQKLLRRKKLNEKGEITLKLPKRPVEILGTTTKEIKTIKGKDLTFKDKKIQSEKEFLILRLLMQVSKGTYIRQLAEDIGEKLGRIPAMLYSLERTKIGKISKKDILDLEKLQVKSEDTS